jgi:uncharacterized integral membrane protein (TIGR00698 family)
MKSTLIAVPNQLHRAIFIVLVAACVVLPMSDNNYTSLVISAPIALLLGLGMALIMGHPFIKINKKATTLLLQVSVVCLGFNMNFEHAMQAGKEGFLFTVTTIAVTLVAGYFLGKLLKIDAKTSTLISNGTAICGGSAIAAIAPIIQADEHEISVSLGTVFILNSIALFVFPTLGHLLHFNDKQFGMWCAIAIHDTSSVVGAASKFSNEALQIATTIKLERALWIIPLSLMNSYLSKQSGKIKIPYFIFYFIIAIVVATYLPRYMPAITNRFDLHFPFQAKPMNLFEYLFIAGKKGLVVTLFLIGSGLSLNTIKKVGFRPILQGVLLWLLIGGLSLFVIKELL